MSDFEISDRILAEECERLARDILEEFTRDNPGEDPRADNHRNALDDHIHSTVDGHEWVIYNHKALKVCAECDTEQGEEFLAVAGMPEDPDIYKLACLIVYGEMLARTQAALETSLDTSDA